MQAGVGARDFAVKQKYLEANELELKAKTYEHVEKKAQADVENRIQGLDEIQQRKNEVVEAMRQAMDRNYMAVIRGNDRGVRS
jgi:hypothetical protein